MQRRPEVLLLLFACAPGWAQQPAPAAVGAVATQGAAVSGVLHAGEGLALLGNNGAVTAGNTTATVRLTRGGEVQVCTGTTMHIAREIAPHTSQRPGDAGLMLSLDHGAIEGHYTPGAFADEILTPDLRLLISAPGVANFSLRVNASGDTCFENAGADAPYVVASSLMNGGMYRIQPGQRVLFVGGSLSRVVDNEHEPCGCPPVAPSTEGNQFPLAVSEGLQSPPTLTQPVVPEGVAHVQATATLSSSTPPKPEPQPPKPVHRPGFFHRLAHAIQRIFGGE